MYVYTYVGYVVCLAADLLHLLRVALFMRLCYSGRAALQEYIHACNARGRVFLGFFPTRLVLSHVIVHMSYFWQEHGSVSIVGK
jgi:hypothetical protein